MHIEPRRGTLKRLKNMGNVFKMLLKLIYINGVIFSQINLITPRAQREWGVIWLKKKNLGVCVIFRTETPISKKFSTLVGAIIRTILKKKFLILDTPFEFYNEIATTLFKN